MGLLSTVSSASEEVIQLGKSFYELDLKTLRGENFSTSTLKGQVSLVVNTASKCGFTNQYDGLEKLYKSYKDKNFTVLGFPSNDFGAQEPGSDTEISDFCRLNYGVSFPMFSKGAVKGNSKQEAYKILTEESDKKFNGDPGWNFVKFLVDKKGVVRARFSSMVSPDSSSIKDRIDELLAEQL